MTTEEKLQHFYDSTIAESEKQSTQMLEEYKAALRKVFDEHKEEMQRKADLELKIESENLTRQNNKELSLEQLQLKRVFNKRKEELKEKLLVEIKNELEQYMTTPDYQLMLARQIKEAAEFAGGEELILYIDPADSEKRSSLMTGSNVEITVSEYSFMGGTRAVIPSKNVLIDHSFQTKLEEFRNKLTLEGGCFDE